MVRYFPDILRRLSDLSTHKPLDTRVHGFPAGEIRRISTTPVNLKYFADVYWSWFIGLRMGKEIAVVGNLAGWRREQFLFLSRGRIWCLYSGVLGFVFSHVVKQGVAEFRSSKGNKCKVEIDGSTKPKAKVRAPWTDSNRNHFSCRRNRRPCCHRDDGSPKSVGKG